MVRAVQTLLVFSISSIFAVLTTRYKSEFSHANTMKVNSALNFFPRSELMYSHVELKDEFLDTISCDCA